jgi:hypothetical protein
MGFFTDSRRTINGEMYWGGHREWETTGGGWYWGAYLNVRPSSQLRLALGPNLSASQDPWIFVAQPRDEAGTPHYVFANIEQRSVSLTTRVNYAFTPKLTLEFYAQPFIAAGEYGRFQEVVAPHADDFDDRFRPFGGELTFNEATGRYEVQLDGDADPEFGFGRPDFNFKELRSNLVLRWEYRPGSALFVVWSQGRSNFEPDGRFRLGRDFGRLFDGGRSPSTNVLLIKMNYWLNL